MNAQWGGLVWLFVCVSFLKLSYESVYYSQEGYACIIIAVQQVTFIVDGGNYCNWPFIWHEFIFPYFTQ
jgi:hypothetical protein